MEQLQRKANAKGISLGGGWDWNTLTVRHLHEQHNTRESCSCANPWRRGVFYEWGVPFNGTLNRVSLHPYETWVCLPEELRKDGFDLCAYYNSLKGSHNNSSIPKDVE